MGDTIPVEEFFYTYQWVVVWMNVLFIRLFG